MNDSWHRRRQFGSIVAVGSGVVAPRRCGAVGPGGFGVAVPQLVPWHLAL
jgi:hypothetical protein